jgi:puromycin-sensitive aminopeptidase
MRADNPYRLPRTVVPERYDLSLEPDLDTCTFSGSVTIAAEVHEETAEVVLNAVELDLDSAVVGLPDGSEFEAAVTYDPETERVTLAVADVLPTGPVELRLAFRGVLNDQLRGFYRSTYTDRSGTERLLATTQFESTNARRAFPCFDEPDLKAVFGVSLVIDEALTAISCGKEVGSNPLGDGRRRVTFADTMLMSTYLVAFVVGDLEATEPVDLGGVPVRVVHVPGQGALAQFALSTGVDALRWLTDYYGIDYPGTKLDLVAVPDFAFGAMENLGCVTFRETLLLVDPARATQDELTRIADVISHELAHMWFGDLVTMRWWEGIWLKEAFATFMEVMTVDALFEEWRRWDQFGRERSAAFDVDALSSTRPIEYPVVSPADAEGMYDILTYEKGAAVVRMMEQFLTPDRFRAGVHHYLTKHAYSSTRTTDLWDALEESSGEPVRSTMDSWIFQAGYPVVEVEEAPEGVRVTQRRFAYIPSDDPTTWSVPLILRARVGGSIVERRVLLAEPDTVLDLGGRPEWVVVNAGAHGFYRVAYASELLSALRSQAQEVLSGPERYALVDDTWASVLAGLTDAAAFLDLADGFAHEEDLGVWQVLTDGLRGLDRILDGDAREAFRVRVAALTTEALHIVGLEPAEGESPLTRELRGLLLATAANVGEHGPSIERGRTLLAAYLADPDTVEPNLAAAAVSIVAAHGEESDYDAFLARYRSPSTPQEEQRFLYALAGFGQEELMERTLAMTLDEVRNQSGPFVVLLALGNRRRGEQAWRFVREHWPALTDRFPSNLVPRLLGGIRTFVTPELAADVEAFLAEHPVPQGTLTVAQHLDKMRVNVTLRQRQASPLGSALLDDGLGTQAET